MSGLVSFFQEELRGTAREQNRPAAAHGTQYHGSTVTLAKGGSGQGGVPHRRPNETGKLAYEEWSGFQKEWIQSFMNKRLCLQTTQQHESTSQDPPEEHETTFPSEVDRRTRKRPYHSAVGDELHADNDDLDQNETDLQCNIPNIRDTLHTASAFGDINLSTKSVQLGNLTIQKVWPFRLIRRPAVLKASPRNQTAFCEHPDFLRMSLLPCEDDGPLDMIYRSVLSIEVTQQQQSSSLAPQNPNNRLRQLAVAVMSELGPPQVKRMQIFFYNSYAKALNSILPLCRTNKVLLGHSLQLQLVNVQPVSILPNSAGSSDWFNQHDASPYCLCFGDQSRLHDTQEEPLDQTDSAATTMAYHRFDGASPSQDDAVEIRVLLVSIESRQVVREWEISHRHKNYITEVTETAAIGARQRIPVSLDPDNGRQVTLVADKLGSRANKNESSATQYTLLSELETHYDSHNASAPMRPCVVNIYGVALGFCPPSLTKRQQWMISIALVDDSLEPTFNGHVPAVAIIAFAKTKSALPDVRYCGDVVRIHRVKVQKWKGDVQLMGGEGTSYLVFRQDYSSSSLDWIVRSPSKKCSVGEKDEERFPKLWKWGQKRIFQYATIKSDYFWNMADVHRFSIDSAEPDSQKEGDLTVMVTAMIESPTTSGISAYGFLRVWDGTGAPSSEPYLPFWSPTAGGDPPPAALSNLSRVVMSLQQMKKYENLAVPEAVTGRVANVAVWEKSHWDLLVETTQIGSFIRLRNVRMGELAGGQRCLMLSAKTHVTPLPSLTYEVAELIKAHDERLKLKDPLNPNSGVLPLSSNTTRDSREEESLELEGEHTTSASAAREIDENKTTSSLTQFAASPEPSCFVGGVKILDTFPSIKALSTSELENTFRSQGGLGLRLQGDDDDLECIDVIVGLSSSAAQVLLRTLGEHESTPARSDALSHLRETINERRTWIATIFCIVHKGERFFQLDTLEASST